MKSHGIRLKVSSVLLASTLLLPSCATLMTSGNTGQQEYKQEIQNRRLKHVRLYAEMTDAWPLQSRLRFTIFNRPEYEFDRVQLAITPREVSWGGVLYYGILEFLAVGSGVVYSRGAYDTMYPGPLPSPLYKGYDSSRPRSPDYGQYIPSAALIGGAVSLLDMLVALGVGAIPIVEEQSRVRLSEDDLSETKLQGHQSILVRSGDWSRTYQTDAHGQFEIAFADLPDSFWQSYTPQLSLMVNGVEATAVVSGDKTALLRTYSEQRQQWQAFQHRLAESNTVPALLIGEQIDTAVFYEPSFSTQLAQLRNDHFSSVKAALGRERGLDSPQVLESLRIIAPASPHYAEAQELITQIELYQQGRSLASQGEYQEAVRHLAQLTHPLIYPQIGTLLSTYEKQAAAQRAQAAKAEQAQRYREEWTTIYNLAANGGYHAAARDARALSSQSPYYKTAQAKAKEWEKLAQQQARAAQKREAELQRRHQELQKILTNLQVEAGYTYNYRTYHQNTTYHVRKSFNLFGSNTYYMEEVPGYDYSRAESGDVYWTMTNKNRKAVSFSVNLVIGKLGIHKCGNRYTLGSGQKITDRCHIEWVFSGFPADLSKIEMSVENVVFK